MSQYLDFMLRELEQTCGRWPKLRNNDRQNEPRKFSTLNSRSCMPRGVTNLVIKKCWLGLPLALAWACWMELLTCCFVACCMLYVCLVVYRFVRFSFTYSIFFVYLCCVFVGFLCLFNVLGAERRGIEGSLRGYTATPKPRGVTPPRGAYSTNWAGPLAHRWYVDSNISYLDRCCLVLFDFCFFLLCCAIQVSIYCILSCGALLCVVFFWYGLPRLSLSPPCYSLRGN